MSKQYNADKFNGGEFLGINADTITTAVSITNATLTDAGYSQSGKVVLIANGANVINYTVNAGITASFVKGGAGAITFVQGAGRTLTGANGLLFDGEVNSKASIVSFGTTDVLYIDITEGGVVTLQEVINIGNTLIDPVSSWLHSTMDGGEIYYEDNFNGVDALIKSDTIRIQGGPKDTPAQYVGLYSHGLEAQLSTKGIVRLTIANRTQTAPLTLNFPDRVGTQTLATLGDINATVPTTSTSTGISGQYAYDTNYFYVCVATNTWVRTALTTW